MRSGKTTTRTISYPKPLERKLLQRARLERRPISSVVQKAIEIYLGAVESTERGFYFAGGAAKKTAEGPAQPETREITA